MIGLIDVDSKIPNLALMKISTYYKSLGEEVECERLQEFYEDRIEIGGTGWDIKKTLDYDIEICKPDYDLYSVDDIASRMKGIGTKEHKLKKAAEIVNAGKGFTSRGCIRKCPFVMVYNENEKGDVRLKHFARWVNGIIYRSCSFEEYEPWAKAQQVQKNLFGMM